MARVSVVSAVVGPCIAVAAAVALAACSADDPAHRSFRPEVVTAAGVPYTGNGIAEFDPQAIVSKAVNATSSASAVQLAGTLTGVPVPKATSSSSDTVISGFSQQRSSTSAGTFTLDMVFTQFGAVGDITDGSATARLLRIEDQVWSAQPSSFWKAAGAADGGKAFGGLYVKIPSADPRYAGFSNDTRIGYLLDHLLQTSATWKKGPLGTVDGMNALELDGTGSGGHKAAVWVATDGAPYLIRIAPTAGSYRGQLDFTGYDARLAVQAPLPGQVLDNALLVLPSSSPSSTPYWVPSTSGSPTGASSGPASVPASPTTEGSSTSPSVGPTASFTWPTPTPSASHKHGGGG
ncbi:MAG TPA: hypothetical protein VGZ32_24255 [Actinocrinis sp.]|jgi:hypothetical protein|uniref:hypothetical protein n=1 Tax=Actinocrinis sp. TaxID=1920516 RepID=UPI002DDCECC8|nr:hypothetical protein [Actinocrinis sp.]HEV3173484.1 hypothetical protein [Actinocrinis sp.]